MIGYFFGWYTGQVWPNLLASGVTAGIAVSWSHRRLARGLRQNHMAATDAQTRELKDHIDARLEGRQP